MELWVGAVNLGFLYAFMAMGIFITFRIHDFPDITVDGSFTSGAAVAAVLLASGINPFLALIAAFLIGMCAGWLTALINTRFNVNGLLAGILVMTALYSINLHIMGRSNIPLLNRTTVFSYLLALNPGLHPEIWTLLALTVLLLLFWLVVSFYFKTDLGIAMRITGNNPDMAAANGVNVVRMTMFGVALANGFVGISGALVAQYQGFADIGMGIGTIVIGLAAVIIGESVLKINSMYARILSVIIGSIIFRLMIAIALYVGMNPIDLKLLTAAFVLLTLVVSKSVSGKTGRPRLFSSINLMPAYRKLIYGACAAIVLVLLAFWGYYHFSVSIKKPDQVYKIGCVQLVDNGLLNITRDSLAQELEKIGYTNGETCMLFLENAHGDLPTVNSIIDKFIQQDVDVIVPISTACTQAAINKVKDRPIVFATIANPFIIGAGSSDNDHLPNVTGVYGWTPPDKTLGLVKKILPDRINIGTIWDPSQANSVFNVENLSKAARAYDDVDFTGATITNTSEVYQAAMTLVQKGIDAFVLSPDNLVYSAFDSVIKAARTKNIPIILNDVERLEDGALMVLGYDYTTSGIQAAHLIDRILKKGESIKDIPFERYKKLTFGINLDAAKRIGITIPRDMISQATKVIRPKTDEQKNKPKIGVIQFALEPNVEICKQGIIKALEDNGYTDGKQLDIIYKNAQADFSMIPAIIQDLIRRDVSIIVPLSTPCVQSAVQSLGSRDDIKVVFTYIYDPYCIGAATTPQEHLPNMSGVSCFPPVEGILELIGQILPERKKIGIVWNSSEANSEAVLLKLRSHAVKTGHKIIETTVTSPAEVLEASRSLANKGAQVFLNGGDNTLNVAFDSFVKVARENKIPVFSVDSEFIDKGAFAVLGPDYYQTGYEGGQYLVRVLEGENIADIPISQTQKTLFMINMDIARKYGIKVSNSVLKRAQRVIDSTAPASSVEREKKLALFLFSDNLVLIEASQSFKDELEQSGILKQYNITIDTKNAQNESSIAQSIAQDIVRQDYDYVVTLSTLALQAMANSNKKIPHVFGAVTDPYRSGVAKSSEDHLPNLTGLATFQPVESTIKTMRKIFPQAKRIGMIWNPAEACSEACTYKAREAAAKYDFELVEANIGSTGEVTDAVKSILNKNIDLFLTSGDNTVSVGLVTIADILKQHRIPYFTNAPADVDRGVFIGIGADYVEVGRATARMTERVIRGEDPADIPIRDYRPEKMSVNLALAKLYGITVPPDILERASLVKQ